MENELKQIGLRLKGLRDALDISPEEMAKTCNITAEELREYEEGKKDFSISFLKHIADRYNVELTALMFDDDARMNTYYITRKGKGPAIDRVKFYKYEALAAGFNGRKADMFMVTVEPNVVEAPVNQNSHEGHEFNMVIEGRMLFRINGKDIILEEGDSIYFNSVNRHGMQALDNKKVKFLAIVL